MLLLPRCAAPSSTSSSFCCCSSCSTCSCCCRRWTSTKCITNWLLYSCAALQFSHSWPEPLILTMISQATHTHILTHMHSFTHTRRHLHVVGGRSCSCCAVFRLLLVVAACSFSVSALCSLQFTVCSLQSSTVFYSLCSLRLLVAVQFQVVVRVRLMPPPTIAKFDYVTRGYHKYICK